MASVTSLISTLLQPMVEKAAAKAVDQCFIAVNIKEEMSNLSDTLGMIEGALPDAEEKKDNNPKLQRWLRKLDDICYEARDMLEEFVAVSASIKAKRASKRVISNSLPFFSLRRFVISSSLSVPAVIPLRLRCRLANNIRSLRKRLDAMKKDKEIDGILEFGKERDPRNAPINHRPETGPSLDKQRDLFVGREVQKQMIMDKLLNYKDDHVHVVPIWGMGGVGKTTLAQSVYNDEKVTQEMYPSKKWLCVGETKFNAKEIILKITNDSYTNDVEACQKKLKEKLEGGRFLIVLDDVWVIESNEWELFYNPLTEIKKRGLIIITTREEKIINAIGTLVPDVLKPLEYEDSWKIFESHAFINGNSCSDLELKKDIGKQIVKKLNGLPLALKVVGCSLLNETNVETWRDFLRYQEWMPSQNDDGIMAALRWSYDHLPSRLKHCFAYCSLFPKDHRFYEEMLVKMWMAHGFIENVGGGTEGREKKRPEDIGAEYFKQLVNASLFQRARGPYVMHDLIHDLAKRVSTDEIARTNDSLSLEQMEKARHVSIITSSNYWENLRMCNTKRLLTLYSRNDDYYHFSYSGWIPQPSERKNILQGIFRQLKSLRVLVLVSKYITDIPDCISELIHLHYLDIEKTKVKRIPDTICDLYNLQTLVLPFKISKKFQVKALGKLVNLRHLVPESLTTCKGLRNLTSLQELYSISVCKDDSISELGGLRQLRGTLTIKGLENVTSTQDATEAGMEDKIYLKWLSLVFTSCFENTDVQAQVLDALHCPPNITGLTIDGYNGLTSPSWLSDGKKFASLQSLDLRNCQRLEALPPLGQLHSLESLNLIDMGAIKRLGDEFYGKGINRREFFPKLKSLQLSKLENLKEWNSTGIEDDSVMFFPNLQQLDLEDCHRLEALPPLGELHSLDSLCLSNMGAIKRLGDEFYGKGINGKEFFPKLIRLRLSKLENLKEWNSTGIEEDSVMFFPNLQQLDLEDCHRLEALPPLGQLHSLKSLSLSNMGAIKRLGDEFYGKGINGKVFFPKLKSLQLSKLENLKEWNSTGIEDDSVMFFPNLQQLDLEDCHRLEALPPLGQLHSLESLSLSNMGAIKRLGDEFYGKGINGKVFFPKLKTLSMSYLENLKEWNSTVIEDDSIKIFPCLTTLRIETCPMSVLPYMNVKDPSRNFVNVMGSLSELHLRKCDGLVVLKLGLLVSLKKLLVRECEKLRSLSISRQGWNSLQKVDVRKCRMLEEVFEDNASTSSSSTLWSLPKSQLRELHIDSKLVLSKLFEHDLCSLERMCIINLLSETMENNWPKLKFLKSLLIIKCDDLPQDIHKLSSLKKLELRFCSKLKALPDDGLPHSLERLLIRDLYHLESLPRHIHKLSSLKVLVLSCCPKLKALPDDGLPPSLEDLLIERCPFLYERCKEVSGLDWHKIKHVRERDIYEVESLIGRSGDLDEESLPSDFSLSDFSMSDADYCNHQL